jgi:hypothetical protein
MARPLSVTRRIQDMGFGTPLASISARARRDSRSKHLALYVGRAHVENPSKMQDASSLDIVPSSIASM